MEPSGALSRPLRIVHFINSLKTGGAERLVVDLATAAQELGHDVLVVTIHPDGGIPADDANSRGLRVVSLDRGRRDPRLSLDLRRLSKGADILHVHLFPPLYWGALIPGPKVYTEHSSWNRRREIAGVAAIERTIYRRYQAIVSISRGVQNELKAHLRAASEDSRFTVVPNGVRSEFFDAPSWRKPRPGGSWRTVSVGSLSVAKNYQLLIDVVATIPNVTLDIIGEGPLRSELELQVEKLGLNDRVNLVGARSNLAAILPSYDLFVSSSSWEGFGIAIVEAMAAGLPVVVPDVAGVNDIVEDGVSGVCFDLEGDPVGNLSHAIRSVMANEQVDAMAAAGRRRADEFHIEACSDAYIDLYRRAIAEESQK